MNAMEQRAVIKFHAKIGKTPTETCKLLQRGYGESCLSANVFGWHKHLHEGRESLDDDPRSGHPSTSSSEENVKRVCNLLATNRRLSCRMIADELKIAKTVVHEIIRGVLRKKKVREICPIQFDS